MYDGSTGAAEAVLMANRVTRRAKALISGGLHPHYRDIIETTRALARLIARSPARPMPKALEDLIAAVDKETSCVVVQNPSFFGHVRDLTELAAACHAAGALLIVVVTEVVSLGLIKPPGEMGADIVVGEGQSIGNGLGFGGPYVGLFATRDKYVRQMPGRLVGETVDADGKRGFVLTLSHARAAYPPREGDLQHLHQCGPLRARLHGASDPAGRGGLHAAWPSSTMPRRCELADRLAARAGREAAERQLLQRIHRAAARSRRRRWSRRWPSVASLAACRCRGCSRTILPSQPPAAGRDRDRDRGRHGRR